jgi:hypothetical protein
MKMRKQVFYTLFALLLLMGCKDESCMINEAYVYPIEAAKGKSFEERIEMFKIPNQVLHCLSTKALVETCLGYPEFGLIYAYSSFQQGFYHVSIRCNGFDELWERGDKFKELCSLYRQKNPDRGNWDSYTDLENGNYLFHIICVELILSQYEILHDLAVPENLELFQLALDNQKKKVDLIKYWGVLGMEATIVILGRIMYLDNYEPLVQEYNNNRNMFYAIDYGIITDYEVVNKIMSLSEDYLKNLKSKEK